MKLHLWTKNLKKSIALNICGKTGHPQRSSWKKDIQETLRKGVNKYEELREKKLSIVQGELGEVTNTRQMRNSLSACQQN